MSDFAERRLQMPFQPAIERAEFGKILTNASTVLNTQLTTYQCPPYQPQPENVRLIDRQIYHGNDFLEIKGGNPAFYDHYTGTCYLSFDSALFDSDFAYRIVLMQRLAHEMHHQATNLNPFQFGRLQRLVEGSAELFSKGIMLEVLPEILTPEQVQMREVAIKKHFPFNRDGIEVRTDDLMAVTPDDFPLFFVLPDMRMVEALGKGSHLAAESLQKGMFTNNPTLIVDTLTQVYNPNILDDIKNAAPPYSEVLDKLSQNPQSEI